MRFTKKEFRPLYKNKFVLLFFIGLIVIGCGTSEKAREKPLPSPNESKKTTKISSALKKELAANRSEAKDVFTRKNEIPAYFLKKSSSNSKKETGNPFVGYRVQIISTRNIQKADSVAATFRSWADKHIIGYFPKTYVVFDQPYYKVHIGNFQSQKRASDFTKMLKSAYPGAWVVHDRIEPDEVPKQEIRIVED